MWEWVKLTLLLINVSCQASQPNTHYFFHKLEPRKMQFLLHQLNIMHYTWQHLPKVKSLAFSNFNSYSMVLLHRPCQHTEINRSIPKILGKVTYSALIYILPKWRHSTSNHIKKHLKKKKQFLYPLSILYILQSNFTWTTFSAVVNPS